tara:strand:- start:1381 stop:2496 length:1116 start_codon:yes stop_codon:yes gene_type:complete
LKALQLINSLTAGGAEKLLVNSVIEYHKKGIDVNILLINGGSSPFLQLLRPYPEIKVFNLGKNNNIYNPKYILKLRKFFKNYDVVHVHLFPSLYWASIANFIDGIFGKKKYKLVYTEHNTTNRRREKKIFKLFDRIIYNRFDAIVSISDAVDSSLKQHLGKKLENKIIQIYNGIDLKEIIEAKKYSRNEIKFDLSDKLILQVSSFTPQKNQQTLIKSLKYLPNSFKLILVGDGVEKENCINIAQKMDISDRVSFLGIRKDVPRLLKSVDVVVLSSHFEGLSLASVEGLASGKPLIASDVPGLTEVVEGAGILFEDNNEKQLANLILSVCTNDIINKKTISDCINRSKKFDILTMTQKYSDLYKELFKQISD